MTGCRARHPPPSPAHQFQRAGGQRLVGGWSGLRPPPLATRPALPSPSPPPPRPPPSQPPCPRKRPAGSGCEAGLRTGRGTRTAAPALGAAATSEARAWCRTHNNRNQEKAPLRGQRQRRVLQPQRLCLAPACGPRPGYPRCCHPPPPPSGVAPRPPPWRRARAVPTLAAPASVSRCDQVLLAPRAAGTWTYWPWLLPTAQPALATTPTQGAPPPPPLAPLPLPSARSPLVGAPRREQRQQQQQQRPQQAALVAPPLPALCWRLRPPSPSPLLTPRRLADAAWRPLDPWSNCPWQRLPPLRLALPAAHPPPPTGVAAPSPATSAGQW